MVDSLSENQVTAICEFFSEFPLEDTNGFLDNCFQGELNSELVEPADAFLLLCELKKLLTVLKPKGPDLLKPTQVN